MELNSLFGQRYIRKLQLPLVALYKCYAFYLSFTFISISGHKTWDSPAGRSMCTDSSERRRLCRVHVENWTSTSASSNSIRSCRQRSCVITATTGAA